MNLLEEIQHRIVLFDGATGTRLHQMTEHFDACVDGFNIDEHHRETVREVHRSYVDAGADVIQTNTFGGNRLKLSRFGFANRLKSINEAGVRLAKDVAGADVLVGGSVGPLEVASSNEDPDPNKMTEIFHEQVEALVDSGIDLLVFETFQDLEETRAALETVEDLDLPVVFEIGGVRDGYTGAGTDARRIVQEADRKGADVIGTNCRGPYDVLETIELIAEVTSKPIIAQANAGSPELDRGRMVFEEEPDDFRTYAPRWVNAGAVILGGCCGTNVEHIQILKQTIEDEDLSPPDRKPVSSVRIFDEPAREPSDDESDRNPVKEVMEGNDDIVISVEMRPSRTMSMETYLDGARRLAREGISLFDVPDNAAAKVAIDPVVASTKLQEETRLPVVMHLGTTHRNLIALQSFLLGMKHAGINGVLAVTGDHPDVGEHDKYAEHVTDIKSSVGLMELMDGMNQGHLFNDSDIKEPTNFYYGGGIAPGRNMTAQKKWLEQKVEAGAQFCFSQPLYSTELIHRYMEATEDLGIRRFVGLLPITSKGNARFFGSGSIPGIVVPDEVVEQFEQTDSKEDARKLGMDLTLQMIEETRDILEGLYIIPPFGENKFDQVIQIVRHTL